MNKKTRLFYRRIVSFTSSVLLTAQSIFPAFYVLPAYAEEVSPTPTQTESSATVTPTSTPETTPTETISPTTTVEPTSTVTPETTPLVTTTPTEAPTPTETISPTSTESQVEVSPTTTTTPTETSPPQNSNSNDSQNQNSSDTSTSQNTTSTPTETISPTPTESPKTIEPVTLQATILPDTNAQSVLELDLDTIVETSATVTTDKLDYAPTDTALITGTNYLPNTNYTIKITSSDEPPVNHEASITANEEGNIYYSYQLDGTYRPNYHVEVKNTSGATLATTNFTDGRTINNVTVNGSSSTTVDPNENVLVKIDLTTDWWWWEDDNWKSTAWRFGNSGSWSCIDTNDHTSSGLYSESFNISAPGTSGTYDLQLKAYNDNSCTYGESDIYSLKKAVIVSDVQHIYVGICHSAGQSGNYTSQTVDDDSIVKPSGHDGHTNDIIPSFTYYGGTYLGKNLGSIPGITWATGQDILNNGCIVPPQKGNLLIQKFEDLDGDHTKDANETGGRIDGWQVSLYSGQNCTGSSINSGTTDNSGQIQFNNLSSGSYSIKETLKAGWQNTTGTNLCQNVSVSGGNTTTSYLGNQRNYVNLTITKTDDVDPVYSDGTITYTISWTKDSNTDANITLKEAPTNTVGAPIDFATTGTLNPTWTYCGSQMFCKDLGTKAAGSQFGSETFKVKVLNTATTGNQIDNVVFIVPTYISWAGNATNDGQQVAEQYTNITSRPGSIKIIKDSQPNDDQNFIFDVNTSTRYIGSAELDDYAGSSRSDNYTFTNLTAGSYSISERTVSGWNLDSATCTGGSSWNFTNKIANVTISNGENYVCTFVNKKLGSISGHKWNDSDGDGHKDGGESYLRNWTIFIDKDRDGYNDTFDSDETKVTTDSDGDYTFGSLAEGTYRICEVEKSNEGWSNTNGGICKNVTISVGENKSNIDFGNRQRGSIRVCKIITNGTGNVVNGSDLPTTTFSIRWDKLATTTFTSGYTPNTQILSTSDGNDAYCTTYSNLPIDNYRYNQETISGSTGWLTAKYNDQFDTSVNDLGDFYTYNSNTDSNGDINLALEAGVNRTLVILNQYSLGNLDVVKFLDYDGDGVKDDNGNEYQMSGWTMEVYSGSGCAGQVISNGSKSTNSDGIASFTNLVPGNYSVKENMGDRTDWINTTSTCQNVTVSGGRTSTIYVGNFQKGTVMGCKYDDVNGSGIRSGKETNEGITEPQMSGWTIRLYNSDWEKVGETVTNPYFYFNNVMEKGTYYLCEQMQSGWRQTEPLNGENYGYTAVQNQSGDETEGALCKQVTVDNSGFYGSHYYGFGNQRVDAKLTISRTNNASVALAPGNAVEHTITIHVEDNNIKNLKLTDLLPKGFTFRPMSYTVLKNLTTDITSSIPSPEYHSPGVWTLGSFSKDDTITIKYWADIDSGQQSGIYKDLAWATATDAYGQSQTFYATGEDSTFVSDKFVGTEVTVNKDIVNEVGVDVEKKETKEGAVLGASTDLPATGANELWLMLAVILLIAGSTSIYQTTKSHKHV